MLRMTVLGFVRFYLRKLACIGGYAGFAFNSQIA